MATVTFIKYAKQSASALRGVALYVSQEQKTVQADGQQLVSGQNCTPQLAQQEFIATRNMYRKDSPVYFYHYVQSFHPDELVTGEAAHEIAKEFAAQAWPESEVLIATHIDREHIHSHFIVNSVCVDSGMMLRQGPGTLKRLRPISDEICAAHGLSVLPKQQKKETQGMDTREYRSAVKGESWKLRLMNAIDECMRYAHSREEFVSLMKSDSYDVKWTDTRKSITYTTPTGIKCRDDRLRDAKYLKEAMEREFRIRAKIIAGGIEAAQSAAEYANANSRRKSENGELPYAAGVAQPHECAAQSEPASREPDRPSAGDILANKPAPDRSADHGVDEGGGSDAPLARTGWEAERAFCFSASSPAQALAPVAVDAPAALPAGSVCIAGGIGAIAGLLGDDAPVKDSTTMRVHHERGKKRKLGIGQREDDHSDDETWQQTM